MHLLTAGLPSLPFVHLRVGAVVPVLRRAADRTMPPPWRWVALRPEGPSLGSPGYAVPVSSSLNRPQSAPLAGTSRLHRRAAYTRCLRCAGAPRRPASGSGLSFLPFRPDMPSSLHPEFCHRICPVAPDADAGLRRDRAARHPNTPAIRFTRGPFFEASLVRICYGLSGCSPPWTDRTEFPWPPGSFTSRLPAGRSPFPPLDMTTTDGVMGLAWMSCAVRWSSPDRMEVRGHGVHQPQASRDGGRLWSIMPVWTCP